MYFGGVVTTNDAIKLLEKFRGGKISLTEVVRAFQAPPVADLGFAQVDTHRALRKGFAEVVYGGGKTAAQVVEIARQIRRREKRLLITRVDEAQVRAVKKSFREARHHRAARCVTIDPKPLPKRAGSIAVVCAGTSDLPVAEEAAVTADIMGNRVERVYDVGVAGLHRLLNKLALIRVARVVIVVAGMEGALPSVVAGLVSRPVIAVPTSVGYGANFGGFDAVVEHAQQLQQRGDGGEH